MATNQHVVGDQRDVVVEYADGDRSEGDVLATDAVTDLAVVRTGRKDFPVPEYREELPRTGGLVLAIGSPLGVENTVTAGIVSGPGCVAGQADRRHPRAVRRGGRGWGFGARAGRRRPGC
ncbi:trypsin-like peptidase domain-containing protein [Saccharothrix carnea]|uniref:trypsin-like peptidase domain-containing protein n=1 Tax=Saccharothrix carnea TaxID=1280637 RepID=UPI00095D67EC|nr:hypothetical protein A6A25_31110 [Saccharothrix sp. CB00851]